MCTTAQKRCRSESPSPQESVKRHQIIPKSRTSVRFLILSDTHGHELPTHLPECDVVLHCGDLTEDGSPESIASALESIGNISAELTLVIAGNHEISLHKQYYLSEGGSEVDHSRSVSLVREKELSSESKQFVFLHEGTHTFTLKSGATFKIYASPYTPRYGASAFQYPSNEDRFNPPLSTPIWAENVTTDMSVIPVGVDIVMTHGPPKYILDFTSDGRSAGCEHLRRAIARARPRLHCFGHIHSGYGAQRICYKTKGHEVKPGGEDDDAIESMVKEWIGKNQARKKGYSCLPPNSAEDFKNDCDQTLMVNASLEDEEGKLGNMPWVVELDLNVV